MKWQTQQTSNHLLRNHKGVTIDACSGDGHPDVPSYIYQVLVDRQIPSHGYMAAFNTGNATEEFVRDTAMRTMYAKLNIATASPTASGSYATNPGTLLFVVVFYILRMFI